MLALGRDASSLYIFEYNSLSAVSVPPTVTSSVVVKVLLKLATPDTLSVCIAALFTPLRTLIEAVTAFNEVVVTRDVVKPVDFIVPSTSSFSVGDVTPMPNFSVV